MTSLGTIGVSIAMFIVTLTAGVFGVWDHSNSPVPASSSAANTGCQSASRVVDLEGHMSVAKRTATAIYNISCDLFVGADPKTFVALDTSYFRDANHVWADIDAAGDTLLPPREIRGADPATFALVRDPHGNLEGFNQFYTKDGNHVYADGLLVKGADPATFVIFDPPKKAPDCGPYNAADADHNYYNGGALPPECK